MTRPLVCYHDHCADGFTAAFCAWLHFGDTADYLPVNYGQPPPGDIAGRDLYILDFSYRRPVMLGLVADANSVVVLDHHKTAAEELEGIWEKLNCGAESKQPVILFDQSRSGARLAHNYFFPSKQPPWLVDYVEDRDLWRHALPFTHEVSAFLHSIEPDFQRWSDLARYAPPGTAEFTQLVMEGQAILRFKTQQVERICASAREMIIGGTLVKVVNTSCFFSEVAGKLAEGAPFGAAWFQRADGKVQWSLRSREGGVDVSEIAKIYGGGGHRNAAGFEDATGLTLLGTQTFHTPREEAK